MRLSDGQKVVIKTLASEGLSPVVLERMKHEFELLRDVDSPAIDRVLGLERIDGLPALVSEDFGGESLDRRLGAPLPPGEFLPMALRMACALAEVHRLGLIHKDVKPSNILIHPDTGEVKLADFGIAARAVRESPRPDQLQGSLAYLSPEQTGRTSRTIDSRSDLYSLGVTFFQMLTGKLPFLASEPLEWVHLHIAREPPAPSALVHEVPAALSAIVLKLMAKRAEDRYQSAAGLAADLERCLASWQQARRLEPFALGKQDLPEQLHLGQRLYGRGRELTELVQAFSRAATGRRAQLVLVSGAPGIGKSAVAQELQPFVVAVHGLFADGAFEPLVNAVPYAGIVGAVRRLLEQLLAAPEDAVDAARTAVLGALGPRVNLLAELVPELRLLLGSLPPPEPPSPEAHRRFLLALEALLGALGTLASPMALLLDDLQWADPASLQIVEDLLTSAEKRGLLLIGTVRPEEAGAKPVREFAARLISQGAPVTEFELAPLGIESLSAMISDAIARPASEVRELAETVAQKTGGNPFFAVQFLERLGQEGLIRLAPALRRWEWDLEAIRAHGLTENLAELMAARLGDLGAETRSLLAWAACFGSQVESRKLEAASESSHEQVTRLAREAVQAGLVALTARRLIFLHDRIQQAAYAQLSLEEQACHHLLVGRRLRAAAGPEPSGAELFELVNQFNRGAHLITDDAEREQVAALDLAAGQRALATTAFSVARGCFEAGASLLTDGLRARRHDLDFGLEFGLAEAEYLLGLREEPARKFSALMTRAVSHRERAKLARAKSDLYYAIGDFPKSLEAALSCLRDFGYALPVAPGPEDIEREWQEIRALLARSCIEALLDLPAAPEDVAPTLELIAAAVLPASNLDSNLMVFLAHRAVAEILRHGIAGMAGPSCTMLGLLLANVHGAQAEGLALAQIGCELARRSGSPREIARAYQAYGSFVAIWSLPLGKAIEALGHACAQALETGDLLVGSWCAEQLLGHLLSQGGWLEEAARKGSGLLEMVTRAGFRGCRDHILGLMTLARSLLGEGELGTIAPPGMTEEEFEREQFVTGTAVVPWWHFGLELQARVFAGRWGEALAAARRSEELAAGGTAWVEVQLPGAEYHFFAALARASVAGDSQAPEREQLVAEVGGHEAKLAAWAARCPSTFGCRHALVAAELARLQGRELDAMRLYEEAARSARESGFTQVEGLTFELGARFWSQHGFPMIGRTYLRAARDCYVRWGAIGKVRQLEALHPNLVEWRAPGAEETLHGAGPSLDLQAAIKASQAISGEVAFDRLIERVLETALQVAGAQHGWLLRPDASGLEVSAEIEAGGSGFAIRVGKAEAELPRSLVDFVRRTGRPVVLEAAAEKGMFVHDPYFARKRTRSALGLPIARQQQLLGVLYLENNLVAGAFKPGTLQLLEVLAAQAAISLENARLYQDLHAEITERQEAEDAERFLATVSQELASSLDLTATLDCGLRLALERLADRAIAFVGVPEALTTRTAGFDAEQERLLRNLLQRASERGDDPLLARQAASTLEPQERGAEAASGWEDLCETAEERALVREIEPLASMALPLVARRHGVGGLVLLAADPQRLHSHGLAKALARRIALAVDNAALYSRSQQAIQVREEFLTVASHELRTPITALGLKLQALQMRARPGELAPDQLAKSLKVFHRQVARLQQLMDKLLDLSEVQAGRLAPRREELELTDLVKRTLASLSEEIAASGCALTVEAQTPIFGAWDARLLERVVTELVTNALKFGVGKPVTVRARQEGERALISVEDQGIGLEERERRHIFAGYSRTAPVAHYGGLRIGLYLAHSFVEAHGGTVDVESEPGRGSVFTVSLPLRS